MLQSRLSTQYSVLFRFLRKTEDRKQPGQLTEQGKN